MHEIIKAIHETQPIFDVTIKSYKNWAKPNRKGMPSRSQSGEHMEVGFGTQISTPKAVMAALRKKLEQRGFDVKIGPTITRSEYSKAKITTT